MALEHSRVSVKLQLAAVIKTRFQDGKTPHMATALVSCGMGTGFAMANDLRGENSGSFQVLAGKVS